MASLVHLALIAQFLNSVRRHWGSLVTSGFLIGAIATWQGTGHRVPASLYWAIAVVGLFVAFYRAWNDQRLERDQALAAQATAEAATRVPPRDWNTEWKECADRFKPYAGRFERVDWSKSQYGNDEQWNIKGDDLARTRHLASLCGLTGEMLLASPGIAATISDEIRAEPKSLIRWLNFLKARGELEQKLPAYEVMDDGQKFAIYMGSIPDLADASMRACIDCAGAEFRTMHQ